MDPLRNEAGELPRCTNQSPRGQVVVYAAEPPMLADGTGTQPPSHESVTRARMAERLAALLGLDYAGSYDGSIAYGRRYFVPAATLMHDEARVLGIRNDTDLFGGCVAQPFACTKSITHPLINPAATAPTGWRETFADAVAPVVLKGFSVFSAEDARRAARVLLQTDRVRFKPALGVGGSGQSLIQGLDELDVVLAEVDSAELASCGAVIEQNLDQAATFSVGQVHVADSWIAYYGEQRLTSNNRGEQVYGGSSVHVVRGTFDTLKRFPLAPAIRLAVEQACRYDRAADQYLPKFFASRRNYDVARGVDQAGRTCSGVLEQSWRIGGVSPAEIAALEAFSADPQLQAVRTSTWEVYTMDDPPAQADVYFRGLDSRVGAITKYSTIDAYEYSTDEA